MTEPTITVYQKPTCTKCRQVHTMLKEAGIDFTAVNYYLTPLSESKIRDLLGKMGLRAADLVRTKEPLYRQLEIGKREVSNDELIALMAEHPDLMQRPIVEKGELAVLARPTDKLKDIL